MPGLGGGPLFDMANAFMQARTEQPGRTSGPSQRRVRAISRKPSHGPAHSDSSHAVTELDDDESNVTADMSEPEVNMATSEKAVVAASESDRGERKTAAATESSAKRPAAECGKLDIEGCNNGNATKICRVEPTSPNPHRC